MNESNVSEEFSANNKPRRWIPYVYALVSGSTAFLITVGYRAVIPTNIAWLGQGDPMTGYFGWSIFRNSPWHLPPGANPAYGLEIGNGIIYSDSNPLLALVFKPLSFLLPDTFQYFGIWVLICLCLQAFFSFKIVGLFSNHKTITCLAASFLVISPPMLFRINSHFNLVAHFLILCSLYMLLKPQPIRHIAKWSILTGTSALVHPYLLAMVGIIFIGDAIGRRLRNELSIRTSLKLCTAVAISTVSASWMAGYFTAGDSYSLGGYGLYRMNVLSLIDPLGWSHLLPDLPRGPGDYEGFNYPGLAILILVIPTFFIVLRNPRELIRAAKKHQALVILLAALTLFSITNRIGFGSGEVVIGIPSYITSLAEIFRSSGRMFWPVTYAIHLVIFFSLIRRLNQRTVFFVLTCLLIVQIVDTSSGWSKIRSTAMASPNSTFRSPLQDSFWSEAAEEYEKVRWLLPAFPPQWDLERWMTVADFAVRNGLSTDAAYLARVDSEGLEQSDLKRREALNAAVFEPDSLYFLSEDQLLQVSYAIDSSRDLLALIDGFGVVAPGWKTCSECSVVATEVKKEDLLPRRLSPQSTIEFSAGGTGASYLISGWSFPESEGVWTDGPTARIGIPLTESVVSGIAVIVLPLVGEGHPRQRVLVEVNSIQAGEWILDSNGPQEVVIPVPFSSLPSIQSTGILDIRFVLPDAVQPSALGINSDRRELAVFIYSLKIV